jgi:hypothetical protein
MFLSLIETDNKQILRRCAPQNDIARSLQGDGAAKPTTPIFEGEHEGNNFFFPGDGENERSGRRLAAENAKDAKAS